MKIGVFDSGFGGLSVLHRARKMLPGADYIYYADKKNVPYGEKTPVEIRIFVNEIFTFMMDKEVDAIVIACNTATTIVDKEYRSRFGIPIVGMEPAVKKAVDDYGMEHKKILVAATPVTIRGPKLKTLLSEVDKEKNIDRIALPGLVRFAEKGVFETEEVKEYLQKETKGYPLSEYGSFVLGCTHFNYFKEVLKELFPNPVHFVDGNEGTIHQLIRLLGDVPRQQSPGKVDYYISGRNADALELSQINHCLEQLDKVYTLN